MSLFEGHPFADWSVEPCEPPRWARGGHRQTILGHLLPSPKLDSLGVHTEILLNDGDRLVSFWLEGASSTVVYLFHGLSGSTDSTYMQRTARLAHELGHSVLLVNHRGAGAGFGLARQTQHSGRAEDLAAAIKWGRDRAPDKLHLAIGFSLSANALLLLLSGRRGDVYPDRAVAVNAPINLERTAQNLSRGLNRIYDERFLRDCVRDMRLRHRLGMLPGYSELPKVRTLFEFDAAFTAPLNGFASREDYYTTCSTKDLLADITVPTLVLTARDDPFVHVADYEAARVSPAVRLHIEATGGHMGYLAYDKRTRQLDRWLDRALRRALPGGV
ncbi:MAG: alpha/beta fold hydrolase [Bdellovibrionales bacterium]|nr:alpha/beta fold hydrolase [Bdellovibrionales bacterium]